jgi:transcriptional regulator with XRE-family HTH domain
MAYRLRVKEILKQRDMSMGKLSRGADVPLNTIRRMVNDPMYNPTVATLRKVADYLGLTMDELYKEVEDDKESPEQ